LTQIVGPGIVRAMRSFHARVLHTVVAGSVATTVFLPSTAQANPLAGIASFQEPMDRARELYTEGESLYSAADYNGAIDKFTEALTLVSKHGSVQDAQVRGLIMFNIAKAHIEAYEVDTQLNHLRQARSIYKRFVTEGEAAGYQATDISEAKAEIERLEIRIAEIEEEQKAPEPSLVGDPEKAGPGVDIDKLERAQHAFGLGIGLTVGGVVLVGGGIAAVIWGSGVDGYIRDEINKKRDNQGEEPLSVNPVRTDDEKNFADREQVKGNVWLGVGAAALTLGAAGIGVGAWQLSKSKKLKAESVAMVPMIDRDTAGLMFSGRF